MNHNLAVRQVSKIISQLFADMQTQIQQRETLKKLPNFLTSAMWQLAVQNIIAVMPQSGGSLKKAFQQQLLIEVPKLEKDTLMPKDLSQEKVRLNSPRKVSPQSSRSSARKSINVPGMASIKLTDKLKSISVTDKKLSNRRQKPNKQQNFSQLNINAKVEDQESQVSQLRQKTEIRMQYLEQQTKLKQERQKYYKEKLKRFNEAMVDQSQTDVAFDYEGDPLRRTLLDEEMRLHKMKAGVSYAKKNAKDGFSRLNAPQLSQIEVKRKHRERGESFRALRPLEIPTFYMKNVEQADAMKLKMTEYRKRFGRGYSRLGNQTIQVQPNIKTKSEIQIQKELSNQDVEAAQSTRKLQGGKTGRRLALPRLHGKYKVLDRYQDN